MTMYGTHVLCNPVPPVESRRQPTGRVSVDQAATLEQRSARELKFRQAAFVYLHAAVLREASAYEMWRAGLLPFSPLGSPLPWLVIGGFVALLVFFAILRWRNVHFVRILWVLDAILLFPLIRYAFFAGADRPIPRSFYIVGIGVIMITLWMLARAGWDL